MENVPVTSDRPPGEMPPTAAVSGTPGVAVPSWLTARRARPARSNGLPNRKTASTPADSAVAQWQPLLSGSATSTSPVRSLPAVSAWQGFQRLLRGPKCAAMYGVWISLAIHVGLLVTLAVFAIGGQAILPASSVLVEFGNPGGDTIIDPELEASLEMDGGHEAAPPQAEDLNQPPSLDAINFNPGEALEGIVNGVGTGDGRGIGDGTGSGTGTGISIPAINVPSFAVSKGSFSAWTEPRDPEPNRQYMIVIQVRLPANIREYRGSDLTGKVIGTDAYKQIIKYRTTDKFPVKEGAVEFRIPVPGGSMRVRDTIQVESRLLREKQTLKIEF